MDGDDDDSVRSVSPFGQVLFWTLTISFMVKLVTLVVFIFIVPNNEWVVLTNDATNYVFMRGITGSDCVNEKSQAADISCIRWAEGLDERTSFYEKRGVDVDRVQEPSSMLQLAFYIAVLIIIVYIVDLAASLAMCCRQRKQEHHTPERQVSVCTSVFIIVLYLFLLLTMVRAREVFITGRDPFAFRIEFGLPVTLTFCLMLVFIIGVVVANAFRFPRNDFEDLKFWKFPPIARVISRIRGGGGTHEEIQLHS
ncbi:Protein T22E5.6 [Aphelenchoides avenae]|nr:Protein T22E5.6 [Aphelenchus avenae]